jgi:hypothetical protein
MVGTLKLRDEAWIRPFNSIKMSARAEQKDNLAGAFGFEARKPAGNFPEPKEKRR